MTLPVTLISNHSQNTNDEWSTPCYYVDSAKTVMGGIDCDPATNVYAQEYIQAGTYYTIEDNSLDKGWSGRVWLNPPYSRIIKKFIKKLVKEYKAGNVTEAIVLTNNGTDTKWFHEMQEISSAICLPEGRIAFIRDGEEVKGNNKGQVFTYIGNRPEAFEEVFDMFGKVYYKGV